MKGGRILIVDDEPLVRETMARLLREEGYVVDCAEEGGAAIALLRRHPPDAILLDLMMPGMNGRQFLDALRNELGHTNVPVVVMTAVHGLGQRALSLGADDLVEKPFDIEELLNKVALAVFRSRPLPAGAATGEPARGAGSMPDRGLVMLIDRDRTSLERMDALLSARGYTVLSMTHITSQLPRVARVLKPHAIMIDLESEESGRDLVRELRSDPALDSVPILVFSRAEQPAAADPATEVEAGAATTPVDVQLLDFVEAMRRPS